MVLGRKESLKKKAFGVGGRKHGTVKIFVGKAHLAAQTANIIMCGAFSDRESLEKYPYGMREGKRHGTTLVMTASYSY